MWNQVPGNRYPRTIERDLSLARLGIGNGNFIIYGKIVKLGVKKRGYHLRKFTGPLSFIVTTVLGIVTTPFSIYILFPFILLYIATYHI